MRNRDVAALLDEIADVLEIKGDSPFRVGAYREAARRIENLTSDINDIARENHLDDIPGVGESIAAKVKEYLETGVSPYLEEIRQEVPRGLAELLLVPGIGPKKAKKLYDELGIRGLTDLEAAVEQQKIRKLPGMGEKTEQNILREMEVLKQRTQRLLLGVALPAAEQVVDLMKNSPAVLRIDPAGSIRRRKETIGDIDILAASQEAMTVMDAFTTLAIVKRILAKGPTKSSVITHDNLQIDLRVVAPDSYGSALQYFTGSKSHNITLREIAIRKGLKLSEYGLFREPSNEIIAGDTEEGVYNALGLDWIPPELRENQGEIEAAARHRLPQLVELKDILGDLHAHTNWSDGGESLEMMARGAMAKGYQYLAITDHSRSLGIAHGLSIERVFEQRRQIDDLNKKLHPFRLLAGTEVDIRIDGTIDFPDEILRQFDLVTASVHSGFHQSRELITRRIVQAINNPYVHILNHPSGRLIERREAYDVDMEAVLKAAAETGTALEVNSSPDRLDLSDVWVRRAIDLGITLAISTDAHGTPQLDFMRYGVATARRGWAEMNNILNTLELADLLTWLRHEEPRRARKKSA